MEHAEKNALYSSQVQDEISTFIKTRLRKRVNLHGLVYCSQVTILAYLENNAYKGLLAIPVF